MAINVPDNFEQFLRKMRKDLDLMLRQTKGLPPGLDLFLLRDLSNLTSSNLQISGGRVGINKSPTQGALDVNGDIYMSGRKVLNHVPVPDTRSTNPDPQWFWDNHGQEVLTEFKQIAAVGAPGSGTYGTLITYVSWHGTGGGGGGPINQIFITHTSGNISKRISLSGTTWGAWEQLGIEGLAPNIQFNGSAVGIGKNPTLGTLDVNGIIRQLGGAGSAYVLDRNYISAGGSGYDSIGTHISNLNNATYNGWYSYTDSSANRPPDNNYGTVLVSRGIGQGALASGAWVWQLAFGTGLVRKIYMRNSVNAGAWTSWVDLSDASLVTSGTFADARIPSLNASKITAGTFALARIPTLDTSRVPSLDAGKITTGTFAAARLPAATETAIGAVERATQAEVNAGTDTTRYVSPSGLRNATNIPWAQAAGLVSAGSTIVTVTFPSGRFTQTPHVVANVSTAAGANSSAQSWITSVTTTNFGIRRGGDATATAINHMWYAVQMTSSSASG